ncbi:MAG: HAD-IC family P-type ATPase [Candidatus Kapabacteria bacterium]|nr:HAD-IC family P-type ATPase [Candidatus Kapabacteria bacterium]
MSKTLGTIALENTVTPFNIVNAVLVSVLMTVYLLNDDPRLALDSVGVIIVILANTLIAITQEWRAHRTLEKAVVSVDSQSIHVGEVISIHRGDVIRADGRVESTDACELDTSLLTGESNPLVLNVGDVVYAGTYCVAGSATIVVTALGRETLAHKIEATARKVDLTTSPLQHLVNRLFQWSFVIAVVLAVIDVSLGAATIAHDVDRVRRVATLLLGLIPEGLVFFSTITLTLGLIRISQRGVVVQKLAALESFSRAEVVCMDKTGTLTMNRLRVEHIIPLGNNSLEHCKGLLGSFARSIGDESQVIDALQTFTQADTFTSIVKRIPFSSARKYSSLWLPDGTCYTLGAAESVLSAEHPRWSEIQQACIEAGIEEMRVMVFATALAGQAETGVHMEPLCWIALDDEIREESASTLNLFDRMGIRVMILTGDGPGPVRSLLRRFGRPFIDDDVRSRLTPDNKQDIVRELRKKHHVVMIGDGVNDLPAIKEASVGIAMAESAPVTKLVADVVLERATFAEFPEMIAEGRAAVRTVLSVAKLFLAKNLVLVVMNALAAMSLSPYPLTPRRGALLSIIGVGIPSMFLAATARVRTRTSHFMSELMYFVLTAGTSAVVSSQIVLTIQSGASDVNDHMLFAFLGSIVWSFIVVDELPRDTRMWAIAVASASLLTAAFLAIVPNLFFPLSLLQQFYEIGGPGTSASINILSSCGVGIACSMVGHAIMRWVSSQMNHHRSAT